MIQARCPICSRRFEVESIGDHPAFPFCSERCRLIDLGRWIDGDYAIPGAPVRGEGKTDSAPAEHHGEADPDAE